MAVASENEAVAEMLAKSPGTVLMAKGTGTPAHLAPPSHNPIS